MGKDVRITLNDPIRPGSNKQHRLRSLSLASPSMPRHHEAPY